MRARDGKFASRDDYIVRTAAITATKVNTVISDPISGTTSPKAIPGAVIRYCITVTNAANGEEATNVTLRDVIPATVTKSGNTFVGGSNCSANGGTGATEDTNGSTFHRHRHNGRTYGRNRQCRYGRNGFVQNAGVQRHDQRDDAVTTATS